MYDIIIVGGGFVGLSIAKLLAKYNYKIAVIDKRPENLELVNKKDNRGIALSNTSINILSNIGTWEDLKYSSTPIKSVHISEKGSFSRAKLVAEEHNLEKFGAVVCADKLLYYLNKSIINESNIDKFFAAEIQKIDNFDNHSTIEVLHEGVIKIIESKILIAADGVNSFVRKNAGITTTSKDYKKSALVFNLYLEKSHNYIAYERFCKDVTIAIVPFGYNRAKCILMTNRDEIENINNLSNEEIIEKINYYIGNRLEKIKNISKKIIYPLIKTSANILINNNLVLIGNASNTVHPVAAQGFNLGLRDVATLAEILGEKQAGFEDNITSNLEKYAKTRQQDHKLTANFADRVERLFSFDILPINLARNIGLLSLGISKNLQKKVVKEGLGFRKFLPKIALDKEALAK